MKTPNPQNWHTSDNINGIVNEQDIGSEAKFSISKQDALMLLAMASLSLMAALDGTSISVALPVPHSISFSPKMFISLTRSEFRKCLTSWEEPQSKHSGLELHSHCVLPVRQEPTETRA
jgi:hypothetical protein